MRILLFVVCYLLFIPTAHASIVDALDLSPFVPVVLDALMSVATGCYEFFVGNGNGIIYVLIWGFLGYSIAMYLIKMYFPKNWLDLFGFSGGGDMWSDAPPSGMTIAEKTLKPAMRAIVAAVFLLQIKPVFITEWIVNPFLQFGSIYTHELTLSITNQPMIVECPTDTVSKGWISKDGCDFLVKPVAELSNANNQIIKRGFEFINNGLLGLMSIIPRGGQSFLNIITGILLVFTFVASNFFMALLIIQGIFNFGMSLALYPFRVLTWVAKGTDKWFDPWPAFDGIVKSLKQLIITMIASAFMMTINVAIVNALFRWRESVFVVAADGRATSNMPVVANTAIGFGEHSILWLSAILTFFVMNEIFKTTRQKILDYSGKGIDTLHKNATTDARNAWKTTKDWTKKTVGMFNKK